VIWLGRWHTCSTTRLLLPKGGREVGFDSDDRMSSTAGVSSAPMKTLGRQRSSGASSAFAFWPLLRFVRYESLREPAGDARIRPTAGAVSVPFAVPYGTVGLVSTA
jgi:hypothetical protein